MQTGPLISSADITGIILAGGRATRMGHLDKGLQLFHGKALAAHVIDRLAPQTGRLAINANRHLADYAVFNLPVWPDLLPDFPGPLAGLHSGLTHCLTDYLLTVPCDAPLLPSDLVVRLSHALSEHTADAAFAVTGEAAHRQAQPVFCLLKKTLLPSLSGYLQAGGRKMESWLATTGAVQVWFEDDIAFSNINTLQELRNMEHRPEKP